MMMGWASGIDIAVGVIETIRDNVRTKATRRTIYEAFYEVMKQHDWDTEYESLGIDPVWDDLMYSYGYGDEDEDED